MLHRNVSWDTKMGGHHRPDGLRTLAGVGGGRVTRLRVTRGSKSDEHVARRKASRWSKCTNDSRGPVLVGSATWPEKL